MSGIRQRRLYHERLYIERCAPLRPNYTYVFDHEIALHGTPYIHRLLFEPMCPSVLFTLFVNNDRIIDSIPLSHRLRAIYPKIRLQGNEWVRFELKNVSPSLTYEGICIMRVSRWL